MMVPSRYAFHNAVLEIYEGKLRVFSPTRPSFNIGGALASSSVIWKDFTTGACCNRNIA